VATVWEWHEYEASRLADGQQHGKDTQTGRTNRHPDVGHHGHGYDKSLQKLQNINY